MDAIVQFWIGFTLIAVSGIAVVIGWAFKNGQFNNQERARHLPLESYIPEDDEKNNHKEEKVR